MPKEHGYGIPLSRMMEVSSEGAGLILDVLRRQGVRGTFFTTVRFAENAPHIVRRILDEGHELASHGMEHTDFSISDVAASRVRLQQLSGREIKGYRQPRMMKLDEKVIAEAGYLYDSSLNPTFIPGRYMRLNAPRRIHFKDGVMQIPTSVSPYVRFPLFWLSLHVLPASLYRRLALAALRKDGYFATYFHPWEFYELNSLTEYRLPAMIRRNSGKAMCVRLESLIRFFKDMGEEFATFTELYHRMK